MVFVGVAFLCSTRSFRICVQSDAGTCVEDRNPALEPSG